MLWSNLSGVLAESLHKVLRVQVPLVRFLTHRQMWIDFSRKWEQPSLPLGPSSKCQVMTAFRSIYWHHFFPKRYTCLYESAKYYKRFIWGEETGSLSSNPLCSTRLWPLTVLSLVKTATTARGNSKLNFTCKKHVFKGFKSNRVFFVLVLQIKPPRTVSYLLLSFSDRRKASFLF